MSLRVATNPGLADSQSEFASFVLKRQALDLIAVEDMSAATVRPYRQRRLKLRPGIANSCYTLVVVHGIVFFSLGAIEHSPEKRIASRREEPHS